MAESKRVGGLEVDEDLGHARNLWRVQRAGWIVMALVVIAALAGLFGKGPVASATAEASGLRLEYDRFARHGAQHELRAEIAPMTRPSGTVKLWFDREFLDGVEVEDVVPEPQSVESRGDELWYTFAAPDSTAPTFVTLTIRPDAYWSRPGRAGLEGGGTVSFRQFVYP